MNDGKFFSYSGVFNSYTPQRVKSLSQSVPYIDHGKSFTIKPGSTSYGFMEGPKEQFLHTKKQVWDQMVGKSESGESTKYSNLIKKFDVNELTRANKVLVKGGSDSLSPSPNTWHQKSYSGSAMTTASLLRLNETTTAFGSNGFRNQSQNVGGGIMAEVLHQKWTAKNNGEDLDTKRLFNTLTTKFPQLKTVEDMRGQGAQALMQQVDTSLLSAAVSAGERAIRKGLSSWQINEYVQKKFAKHGLGELPKGWMQSLKDKQGL